MGNRKKPRNPKLRALGQHLSFARAVMPEDEPKVVERTVPAVIHWGDVPGSPRTDDETIGQAITFDDGSTDIIMYEDISDDAKKIIYGAQAGVDHYGLLEDKN
jgi:hypothetical protein